VLEPRGHLPLVFGVVVVKIVPPKIPQPGGDVQRQVPLARRLPDRFGELLKKEPDHVHGATPTELVARSELERHVDREPPLVRFRANRAGRFGDQVPDHVDVPFACRLVQGLVPHVARDAD
jgi:hypothetical protein